MTKVRIYIPSQFAAQSSGVGVRMARNFGGSTMTNGIGSWIDASGNIVRESIDIHESIIFDGTDPEGFMDGLARKAKRECNQECVLWEAATCEGRLV